MSTNKLKMLAISTVLATTVLSSSANANDTGKYYTSITGEYIFDAKLNDDINTSLGSGSTSTNYNNGLAGLFAFGYRFNDNIRTEAEAGYRKLNGKNSTIIVDNVRYPTDANDIKTLTAMANVYYNFTTGSDVSPYLGIGGGLAHEQDTDKNAFAYQAMAGVDYKLTPTSTIFAGYRYFSTTNFTTTYNVSGLGAVTEEFNVRTHAIDAGYRFNF